MKELDLLPEDPPAPRGGLLGHPDADKASPEFMLPVLFIVRLLIGHLDEQLWWSHRGDRLLVSPGETFEEVAVPPPTLFNGLVEKVLDDLAVQRDGQGIVVH